MSKKETIGKTLGVVVGLCLVCAVIVATAAVKLRPEQQANKALDWKRNILIASGFAEEAKGNAKAVEESFSKNIEVRLVNLETGEYAEGDVSKIDYDAERKSPKFTRELDPKADEAKIKRVAKVAPVYLAKDASGQINSVTLPVHGKGLWGTMYGFIALDKDGNTVKTINFYEHLETPGLGAEIQNPKWVQTWEGKKLYKDGHVAIEVVKGGAKSDTQVDGLSGATLTSNGVSHTFRFWAGEQGFGPYLAKVRNGGAF